MLQLILCVLPTKLCICNLQSIISSIDWASSIVGAMLGFTLAITYEHYSVIRKKTRKRGQYIELIGSYKSDKDSSLEIIAEITYLKGDFLRVSTIVKNIGEGKVSEIWDGEINMETLSYGIAGIIFKEHHNPKFLKTIDLKTFVFDRDRKCFTVFSYNKEDYPTPEYFIKF